MRVIIYKCKEKQQANRNGGIHMIYILFFIVIGIPLIKESIENEQYRQKCLRRGDKTYWSTTGLRYTSNNQKVYK